ncbi:MAG TPA: two-component regulator propeller domain-containing protein, partial [Mucilaginibacter sp.]|nr:two-component regulator propeller domain-containing protein [Mucilaginibacter sp.]
RENNIWIGTANGLYKFTLALNSLAISAMPEKDTITGRRIELSGIFITPGRIFLTTNGGGIFYTHDNDINWKHLTWQSNSELNDTWNVRTIGNGSYWIGTQHGLFQWQPGDKHAIPLLLPSAWQWLNALPITTQFVDKENTLWLGLGVGNGVVAFNLNNHQLKLYSRQNSGNFPLRYPVALDEDEYGDLWMGGIEGRGLAHWSRKTDRFTLLPPEFDTDFDNGIINAIYADHRGSLWIGTSGGLIQYNILTKKFKKYSIQQGLSSNTIYSIEHDNAQHLWIGTKNGLSCMDANNGKVFNFTGYYQNSEDPVISVKYDANDDKIYFITPHNFYSITPHEWLRQRNAPQLFITSVISSGKNLNPKDNIRLDYTHNNINIAFSAVNLVDGGQNKYFYRLNNQFKNWISAGSTRQISFSSLLPGRYTFEVKAQLSDGTWGKNQPVVMFSVAPPFWKSWWFILFDIIMFAGIIYLLYRYRIGQIVKLQIIRNRIASDLHDDIGSTLSNIHILTRLSHASLAEPEKADEFLTRIAQEVNSSSQSLDDIVWSINTNNDNFEQMAARMRRYAAELFESSNISYKVDFDEKLLHKKLHLEQRRDIYLIFKEALNNIYKHAQATSVTISLKTDHRYFKMTVDDNGLGFDPGQLTARNGLKNIRTRATNYKGTFTIESKKGIGTTLSVTMRIFN